MDVSIRRNVWDCGAQAQDKCGRAGVAVVIRLARLNNDLRRNQEKTLCMGDANDPSQTVRNRYNKSSTSIGRVIERWANGAGGCRYHLLIGLSVSINLDFCKVASKLS